MQSERYPFIDVLPRLYELKAMTPDPLHLDAYFQNFESTLTEGQTVPDKYLRVERWLAALDATAWHDLRERSIPLLMLREEGRGWRPLFDTFDEALGFVYLKSIGCTNVHFVERSKKRNAKTPDLHALRDGGQVFCEVKTINVSQAEAERRRRIHAGEFVPSTTPLSVTDTYLGKVMNTLTVALKQIDAADPARQAKRIILTVLHVDDWVGQCQQEYIAQLDAHLMRNPIEGAELVFFPASDLFERKFAMQSATVFRD